MSARLRSTQRLTQLDARMRAQAMPLPPSAYADPAWFEREQAARGRWPSYAGHEAMIPERGDFREPALGANGRVLLHGERGPVLSSNVCRHRQARMLQGSGNASRIVCPVHGWTYDLGGRLLGGADFPRPPEGMCLEQEPLENWRGLLLAGAGGLATRLHDFPAIPEFDWSRYRFDRAIVEEHNVNWKDFIDIYLEVYHVGFVHPGLRNWVDVDHYEWTFGREWSCQTMPALGDWSRQESPHYQAYRDAVLRLNGGRVHGFGAIWAMVYPDIMLEAYPHALVVSTIVAQGPERTSNVIEFFYPEEVQAFERDLVEAHQAAYLETAAEDTAICERLHEGRRALWRAGRDEPGPFHEPHEDGIIHFNDWLRRELCNAEPS